MVAVLGIVIIIDYFSLVENIEINTRHDSNLGSQPDK